MKITISKRTLIILAFGVVLIGIFAFKSFTADQVQKAQEPKPSVYVAGGQTYEHNGVTITLPAAWSATMQSCGIANTADSYDTLSIKTETTPPSITLLYDQAKALAFADSIGSAPSNTSEHRRRGITRLLFSLESQIQAERKKQGVTEESSKLYDLLTQSAPSLALGGKDGRLVLAEASEEEPCMLGVFVPYGKDELLVIMGEFEDPQGTEATTLYQSESFQAFLSSITFREDAPWEGVLHFFQGS